MTDGDAGERCGNLRPSQFPGKPGGPACALDPDHDCAHTDLVAWTWTNLRTGARP